MAFKITPPEEKAAASAAAATAEARQQADFLSLVERRRASVVTLEEVIAGGSEDLTGWEVSFVKSLNFKAHSYDDLGVLGGRLASLSDRQVMSLEKIAEKIAHQRHARAADDEALAGGLEPAAGCTARQRG